MGHVQSCDGRGKAGQDCSPLEETSFHISLTNTRHSSDSLFQPNLCFSALITFAFCSVWPTDFFCLFGLWNIGSMRDWTIYLSHDHIPIAVLDIMDFMYSHLTAYFSHLPIKCKLQEDSGFFCLAEKPRTETDT